MSLTYDNLVKILFRVFVIVLDECIYYISWDATGQCKVDWN